MQAIINGEMYEVEPAVKVIIDKLMINNAELKKENARLEEGYQKPVGVIAATDCVECKNKPAKHGEWVDVKFSEGVFKDNDDSNDIGLSITSAKCNLCQRYSEMLQQYRPKMPAYCSHCGAKMDGGAENVR
jgi:hypothetical protein